LSGLLIGAGLFGLGLGMLDEVYQSTIPGRSMDIYDFYADGLGILAAMGVWGFLRRRKNSRKV
jgi:VanZ family protein